MKISLVKINQVEKEEIKSFRLEFLKNKEVIHGSNGLTTEKDIEKWKSHINQLEINPGINEVKTLQYMVLDGSNNLVGVIDLRFQLNSYLQQEGGHIGYSIRKSERGKGYAKMALKEVLTIAKKEIHLSKVLLTCKSQNGASKRVILSSGGYFDKKRELNKNQVEHYYISLV